MSLTSYQTTELLLNATWTGAWFNWSLKIPSMDRYEKERGRAPKVRMKQKKNKEHISKVGGSASLGTLLFVLSDPAMHFSRAVYEENHCRPLKTTYRRSEKGFPLPGWISVYIVEVMARPVCVCVRVCECVSARSLHLFSICKSSHRSSLRCLLEITALKSVHVCLYELCVCLQMYVCTHL